MVHLSGMFIYPAVHLCGVHCIKVCFLPANTTSKLQPLDLGIIKNFKAHYRQLLLSYVISKIDSCSTVQTEVFPGQAAASSGRALNR